MKNLKLFFSLILLFFTMGLHIFSQPKKNLIDQKPVVAGQFYPADPGELRNTLKDFFSRAKSRSGSGEVLAIISPHAGYLFSGQIAATAFNQVNPEKKFKTIFLLGSSHRMSFDEAAIYNKGNFITPLGTVKVDIDLADKLIHSYPVFISSTEAFAQEHSLEVQLPFLQYHLKNDFRIVPILLGTQNTSVSKKIAEALLPYFTKENLFVFSSDFSHYPDYKNAVYIDKLTAEAIISKSPEKFLKTLMTNDQKNIPNLATSACGWPSILSLLYMAEKIPEVKINRIDYRNSGDSNYGDKYRVVGYNALSVTLNNTTGKSTSDFALTENDKKVLLEIARKSIDFYLTNNKRYHSEPGNLSEILKIKTGAFVTLHKDGNLRGCIGRLIGDMPLYRVVEDMAVAAATNDYRFERVSPEEMRNIEIEISVLSPMKRINSIEEIVLGKHGIYLKKGTQSGTFLPQVAGQTNWTKEEFLGHCAKDKAMIGWDGWKDAEIYTYEAFVFSENEVLK